MPFTSFVQLLPEIGYTETRSIKVFPELNLKLPADEYGFMELFCNDKKCDCRRVYFNVFSANRQKHEAIISYGWESKAFYQKWIHGCDDEIAAQLQGPILAPLNPQGQYASDILTLFKEFLLPDNEFIERVKRHYRMFREKIDKPACISASKKLRKR